MILDVGCGTHPRGDVNVDRYIGKTIHRGNGRKIDPKKIPNFILADAMYLPFRGKSFEVVHSGFVIEHLQKPREFIIELMRIAIMRVIIRTDHRYCPRTRHWYKTGAHKVYLNKRWFGIALRQFDYVLSLEYKPFPFLPFIGLFLMPERMKIEIYL